MGFWDRVKARIKQQNTTQAWVAGKIGVPAQTFRRWSLAEKEIMPDADQVVAIAAALGTTVEELVTGKAPGDSWLAEHRQLIADLKALPPETLEEKSVELHALAELHRRRLGKDSASG